MCTEYLVQISNVMNSGLNISATLELPKEQLFHVFPKRLAPIIILEKKEITLRLSQYGLIPAWSKESKLKFATHNARIESITDKPTWRKPFLSKHCLVPIDEFREPVRVGPHANHVISFKSEDKNTLLVAGLYDEWHGCNNEVIHSFAIITTVASTFILSNGHERCPVILPKEIAMQWLSNQDANVQQNKDLLSSVMQLDSLVVERVRELKVANK